MSPWNAGDSMFRSVRLLAIRFPSRADAERQVIVANPYTTSFSAPVSFRLAAYQTTRRIEVWRDGRRLGSWDVSPTPRAYRLLPSTEAMSNPFTLRAPAAPDPQSNRMISIMVFRMSFAHPALTEEKR
jgi:hypothetical protein